MDFDSNVKQLDLHSSEGACKLGVTVWFCVDSSLSPGASPASTDSWTLYSGESPTSSTLGECSSSEETSLSSSLSTFELLTASTSVKRSRNVETGNSLRRPFGYATSRLKQNSYLHMKSLEIVFKCFT